jgi:hypothetical protein
MRMDIHYSATSHSSVKQRTCKGVETVELVGKCYSGTDLGTKAPSSGSATMFMYISSLFEIDPFFSLLVWRSLQAEETIPF